MEEQSAPVKKKMRKGAMNLVILGIGATLVAIVTTGVSLFLYHHSGDIYLDRSRPGYLPDEEEIEEEDNELTYGFSKTGKINAGVIEEYLEGLDAEIKEIDEYQRPFSQDALSNERLGIPVDESAEGVGE